MEVGEPKERFNTESRIRELDAPEEKDNGDKRHEKKRLPPEERARLRAIRDMERAEAEIQKVEEAATKKKKRKSMNS